MKTSKDVIAFYRHCNFYVLCMYYVFYVFYEGY